MDLDRHSKELLRGLEREESFQDRTNLLPCQLAWEEAFQHIKPFLPDRDGTPDLPYTAIAFVALDESGQRTKFDRKQLLVRRDRVGVRFLHRIPTRNWLDAKRDRKIRLNYLASRLRAADQYSLWASPTDDADLNGRRSLMQIDLLKQPLQDHPKYELKYYNPQAVVAGESTLRAPVGGVFQLQPNHRHLNVFIDRVPVFRLSVRDAHTVVTHLRDRSLAVPGTLVEQGTPLLQLTARTHYGEVVWRAGTHRKEMELDIIGGDVLGASGNEEELQLAAQMMAAIGKMANTSLPVEERPPSQPFVRWCPELLLEFREQEFFQAISTREWTESEQLCHAIARECSAGGNFYIRSQLQTAATVTGFSSEVAHKTINTSSGPIVLPRSGQPLPHIRVGTVIEPSDPVAEWLPRNDYPDFKAVLNGLQSINSEDKDRLRKAIVKSYLRESAVRHGQEGYIGEGVLFPASFVYPVASKTTGQYIDLRRAASYITSRGDIVGPPIYSEDWQDFCITNQDPNVPGIGYNWYPVGPKFTSKPVAKTRKRNWR